MTKVCPNCGNTEPDSAKFCMNCGHSFLDEVPKGNSNIFSNGKIFLIIIAVVLVIGAAFILTSGIDSTAVVDDVEHVDLTISEVLGYDGNYDNKTSYTFYTKAIFVDVPSDMRGYIIKTSYCDDNGTVLGSETETLDDVYYDSNYALSFGHYTSYKKLNVDSVKVQIIKNGDVVDEFSEKIDKNKIDFLDDGDNDGGIFLRY